MAAKRNTGMSAIKASVWQYHRKLLTASHKKTVKELVNWLKDTSTARPSPQNIPVEAINEMLVELALYAVPPTRAFKDVVLKRLGSKVPPSFADIKNVFKSLSEEDVSEEGRRWLMDVKRQLSHKNIRNPLTSNVDLTRHPLTAAIWVEPRYVEVARYVKLSDVAIEKMRGKYHSDESMHAAVARNVARVSGISLRQANAVIHIPCYMRTFDIPIDLAMYLHAHFQSPWTLLEVTSTEVLSLLNKHNPPFNAKFLRISTIDSWLSKVREIWPERAYFRELLEDQKLSSKARHVLAEASVSTMGDLRKSIDTNRANRIARKKSTLEHLLRRKDFLSDKKAATLRAHARLEKLSSDFSLNKALIAEKFTSAKDIAGISLAKFKSRFRGKATPKQLERVHRRALRELPKTTAFDAWRNVTIGGHQLDKAIRFPRAPEKHIAFIRSIMTPRESEAYQPACECERCEAVFSQSAYLTALLRFVESYFTTATQQRGLDYFAGSAGNAGRMYRPELKTLSMSCDVINAEIPQPEIAKRVLLNYIIDHTDGMTLTSTATGETLKDLYAGLEEEDEKVFTDLLPNSVNPSPFYYYGTQLNEYLTVLGTSLESIHSAFDDPEQAEIVSKRLAELLGISEQELERLTATTSTGAAAATPTIAQMATVLGVSEADLTAASGDGPRLKQYLGLLAEEKRERDEEIDLLDALLACRLFNDGAAIGSLTDADIYLLIRIVELASALKLTVRETVALIELADPPELSRSHVQQLLERTQMVRALNLDPRELAAIFAGPQATQTLSSRLRVTEETFARMDSPVNIDELFEAWQRAQSAWRMRLPVDALLSAVGPLLRVDEKGDMLAAAMGVTVAELEAVVAHPSGENVAELLGLSEEDLTSFLGDFTIEYQSLRIVAPEQIDSLGALDAVYWLVRIAALLGVNIQELSALATSELFQDLSVDYPEVKIADPGPGVDIPIVEQLILAARHVQMGKTLGLRWATIPDAVSRSSDEATLKTVLSVDDDWFNAYKDPSTPPEARLQELAEVLGLPAADLLALVEARASTNAGSSVSGPGWLTETWQRCEEIRRWVELAKLLGISPRRFYEMVQAYSPRIALSDISTFYTLCALAIERRYLEQINRDVPDRTHPGELISQISWLTAPRFTSIDSIGKVERIYQLANLAQSLDLKVSSNTTAAPGTGLADINIWEGDATSDDVDALLTIIDSRFDSVQRENELKAPQNRILEKTRDALRLYAISLDFRPGDADAPRTAKELGNELLIDLQTASCTTTNLVLQATESLQTYVQRVRTGLEKEQVGSQTLELKNVLATADSRKWGAMERDWQWYRNYVLWEAAQKVYLYPENYVFPQLRDNKTEVFREFEDQLSQGEVTQELAEKAVKDYLEALQPLSALRVAGTVYDSGTNTLHIFARSRISTDRFYHRTLTNQVEWSAWKLVDVEVNADRVFPVLAHNRVYIFWLESEEEDKDGAKTYKHKLCFTYLKFNEKWAKKALTKIEVPPAAAWITNWAADKLEIFVVGSKGRDWVAPGLADAIWIAVKADFPFHAKSEARWLADFLVTCNEVVSQVTMPPQIDPFHPTLPSSMILRQVDYPITQSNPYGYLTARFFAEETKIPGTTEFVSTGTRLLHLDDVVTDFSGVTVSYARYTKSEKNGINVLAYVDGGLSFYSYDLDLYKNWVTYGDAWMVDVVQSNVPIISSTVCESPTRLEVDDAIEVGSNIYFFCSDQSRTLVVVTHLSSGLCSRKAEFSVCEISYGRRCELLNGIMKGGVDGLFDSAVQNGNELESEGTTGFSAAVIRKPSPAMDYCGPNKIYNWEIFFHIPYLVGDSLTQNRKFSQATKWYEYIFNPYKDPQPVDPAAPAPRVDVTWYFAPFRTEPIQQIQDVLNATDDLQAWHRDPFGPHVIARVRPGTYQKAVLLSYIDNLMEWADQDFTEDTRTSINLARNRYLLAEQLLDLGELEAQPACSHSAKTLEELLSEPSDAAADIGSSVEVEEPACCIPENWLDPDAMQVADSASLVPRLEVGCVPENPIFESHWRHIQSNLRKIRTCRNIAGIQRILPLYDAAADPMAVVVRAVGSGGSLENFNLNSSASGVGPYRFSYLIERAKSLAQLVVQAGNALLLAIEKKESEELAFLRAQQELKLTKAQIHLRKLQVKEAEDGVDLAELQTDRATIQQQYFMNLVAGDVNEYEQAALADLEASLDYLEIAVPMHRYAGVASLIPTITTGGPSAGSSWGGGNLAGMFSGFAAAASAQASFLSTKSSVSSLRASYERRREEWGFQRDLAQKDIFIAQEGERIAQDRLAIAEFERQIAEMQAEFADQTLQFLKEKFTNKELYRWMVKILSKVLYGFYNLAYTTARMAQATMEFERNEAQSFISYTYWDSERKGLLSGEELLADIMRMDQAYIEKNHRKLEITKHISLSRMAPEALAELKQTGKTLIAVPMSWFDRDFPGHYQRTIKSVRLSVLALVGPGGNVNATLSTVSPSLVVLHPEDEAPTQAPRYQSVALSGATNASGLFELNYRDERYLPFEGSGVAVTWELEMPKPSNRFDFDSLVDVIMTVDYTALSDLDYKQKIIDELGDGVGGMLPLTVRNTFPDAWYHLHNPVIELEADQPEAQRPYTLVLTVTRAMFPPNEENHELDSAAVLFSLTDPTIRLPLRIRFKSDRGEIFNLRRSTGVGGYLSLESGLAGFSPFGEWQITIERDRAPESFLAKDADGYPITETTSQPPAVRNLLDTEKLTDAILSLTYSAKLLWPPG